VSTAGTISDIGRPARLDKHTDMTPFSAPAKGCGDPGTGVELLPTRLPGGCVAGNQSGLGP
jgi:hypothetical protein